MKGIAPYLLAMAWLSVAGCSATDGPGSSGPAAPRPASIAEARLGIRIEALRHSAAGYMLDFRYRVVDPEKARTIMDRATKPYVIDEASGAKFPIPSSPKIGPMRQTTRRPESGRVYWLLFANPARHIKPGALVTVVVGDVRLEHLAVQ